MDVLLNPTALVRSAALDRVAEAVGCSPSDFFAPPGTHPLAGAAELLRLWASIESAAGRERVLACARVVARYHDASI